MTFKANAQTANTCFRKNNYKNIISLWFFLAITAFEISYRFHKDNVSVVSILFTLICLFLVYIFFKTLYSGGLLINKTIELIEISDTEVEFSTFKCSLMFNMIKKDPIKLDAPTNLIQFFPSTTKYGFDRALTGDIYNLVYEGDEYLMASNFFDNFPAIKASLEKISPF